MRFWLDKGVDGFRCDAAGEMPSKVWEKIIPELQAAYPDAYFLAEAEKPELAAVFDATYAWELHHLMNDIAQGKKTVNDLKAYIAKDAKNTAPSAFRLMFTSNHDENSWAGTEFERMGDAASVMAVLCFTLPKGQPLIYTGQEIGLSRRLAFFEKDPITDWSANEYTAFWKKLVQLKHSNPALAAGEKGGEIQYLDAPEGVFAFKREVKGNSVVVLVSFGVPVKQEAVATAADANDNRPQGEQVAVPFLNLQAPAATVAVKLDGTYTNAFTGESLSGDQSFTMAPGEYIVLTK
jgi:glycosidase